MLSRPQLPAATRAALNAFDMTSLRLSFETMGGRTIQGTNGTLCGWSTDKLRANGTDGGLKVIVLLGAAEVRESFKYTRGDKDALDVPLNPGEILLLHDDGRAWLSAVTGYTPKAASGRDACPFDFAHLSLLDLHSFRQAKARELDKLVTPPLPSPHDGSYKWMQCTYTVAAAGDSPKIELRGRDKQSKQAK